MNHTAQSWWQRSRKILLSLCLLGSIAHAKAAEPTPEEVLKPSIEATMNEILKDKAVANSKFKVYEIVKKNLLPLFDTGRITARSVGREWLNATDAQKKTLMDNFGDILMLTYSSAFAGRGEDKAAVTLTWGRSDIEDKRALVRSNVTTSSGNHQLAYSMRLTKDGWKLDDILVDNLSIFNAYRDQFASILKNNGGIEGLIKTLVEERAKMAQQ